MTLRMGIIGCGGIAGFAASFARVTPGLRLAACCDRTVEAAGVFARKRGIPQVYDDYTALIDDPTVDAVYIAVPHHLHFPILRAAIEAGKPALCEKPITRTLAEGCEIARMAEAAGVKVGINYQYRYDSAAYALASAARSGALGRLLYARCNIPWHRTKDYFEGGAWRRSQESAGGGTLITQGSHMLDLALWAMNSPPAAALGMTARRVFQEVEVEDLANAVVELADGAQINMTSAMIAAVEGSLRVELYGARAVAVYTDQPWPRVRFYGARIKTESPPARGLHALHRSLVAFRDWITADKPYLIPAREALPALAAVEAVYRSARSGKKEVVESTAHKQE